MKIIIEGNPKEIAALVVEVQGRQSLNPKFVPETSEGPSCSTTNVATGASCTDIPKPSYLDTSVIPE